MTVWTRFTSPILILAPMEDVTDTVFRQIVATCTKPDLFFTEFTNVEGLMSRGREAIINRLQFTEGERSIVAQIWGQDPAAFFEVAKQLAGLGFDGIDINMGCPEKNVMKKGRGAALINNQPLAAEIIAAVKKGAGILPVSVKTRIGVRTIETNTWIEFLLKQDIAALTIHGRTAKELSKVPAHWDEIGKAVKIRDELRIKTKIIGNGDVVDAKDSIEKCETYRVDGVMIGRGIFDNMWAFNKNGYVPSRTELLSLMRNHILLFQHTWGDKKPFNVLKKYFKIYINGFEGASLARAQAMKLNNANEALDFCKNMLALSNETW